MRTASSDRTRTIGLAALAVCVLAFGAAGCARKSAPGPLPPDRSAQVARVWPPGRSTPLKITDTLTLSIPLEYERSALHHGEPARALLSVQSDRVEAQFDFFLPHFSGYTLQNYQNELDENKVEVVYLHAGDPHEAEPDAAGGKPPHKLKRAPQEFLKPRGHHAMYGRRGSPGPRPPPPVHCFGRPRRA